MECVLIGNNVEAACCDQNGVVGLKTVLRGLYGIGATGDLQIVLAGDAVPVIADYVQSTEPVQCEVVLREDHGVCVRVPVAYKPRCDLQCVLRALSRGDKDLDFVVEKYGYGPDFLEKMGNTCGR